MWSPKSFSLFAVWGSRHIVHMCFDICAGLLNWLSEDDSPVLRIVNRFFEVLNDVTQSHWDSLRTRDWPRQTERIALTCHARLAASVLLRMWESNQHWPNRAAKVCQGVAGEPTRVQVSNEWRGACEQCLDREFGEPIQAAAFTGENLGVLRGKLHTTIEQTFERAPVANLLTEDRFSRVKHSAQNDAGNHPLPSTVGSDHVLNETKLLHHHSMEQPAI